MISAVLFAPDEYWDVDDATRASIVGGCGPGGIGDWFVPDTIWGLNIKSACSIHDWMYHFGETLEDKVRADRVFLNNMVRLVFANTRNRILRKLRLRRTVVYYEAVKRYGGPAFWDGKDDPNGGRVS